MVNGNELKKAIDDMETDECKKDMKKFVSRKEYEVVFNVFKDELRDRKFETVRVRQRLMSHLNWTYATFFTAFMVFLGVLNGLAGAFMFFHATTTVDMNDKTNIGFAVNDFPYAIPTVYFIILWIVMFIVIVYLYFYGLSKIEDMTVCSKESD
jgi:hypothetical protein